MPPSSYVFLSSNSIYNLQHGRIPNYEIHPVTREFKTEVLFYKDLREDKTAFPLPLR